jgi:hypothetical protein
LEKVEPNPPLEKVEPNIQPYFLHHPPVSPCVGLAQPFLKVEDLAPPFLKVDFQRWKRWN